MKTFKDLEFKNAVGHNGVTSRIHFENGWGASVVKHDYSYGGKEGLYELAVIKDGDLHYDNPVANGDVLGYLDEDDVTNALKQIQQFK